MYNCYDISSKEGYFQTVLGSSKAGTFIEQVVNQFFQSQKETTFFNHFANHREVLPSVSIKHNQNLPRCSDWVNSDIRGGYIRSLIVWNQYSYENEVIMFIHALYSVLLSLYHNSIIFAIYNQ